MMEEPNLPKKDWSRIILLIIIFLISIFAFATLAHEVVREKDDLFDNIVFSFLKNHSTPGVIQFFKMLTFFGSMSFLLPAYFVIVIILFFKNERREGINMLVVGATSTALMYGLKMYYSRVRPELPLFETLASYSFPSGHALSSFVFFSLLVHLVLKTNLDKRWKWLLSIILFLIAFLIGISRIVLRYHYASDVLAGFCMGSAWVILSLWLLKKFKKDRK